MLSEEIINKYRKAGEVVKECRKYALSLVREGASVIQTVNKIEEYIIQKGAMPAFPVNIAVDHIAAHFTPHSSSDMKFTRGSLVKIDIGAHVDGYIADTAVTIEVDTQNWRDIITASKEALNVATELIRAGMEMNTIGTAIEQCIKSFGYIPIENLTGHSMVRYNLHAGMSIPNVPDRTKEKMTDGMVIAVEPFATDGSGIVKEGKSSNIYRMIKKKFLLSSDARGLMDKIEKEYLALPFAQRWLYQKYTNIDSLLQLLVRHGVVKGYPILMEVEGSRVSQAEHTLIVTSDGVIQIT